VSSQVANANPIDSQV